MREFRTGEKAPASGARKNVSPQRTFSRGNKPVPAGAARQENPLPSPGRIGAVCVLQRVLQEGEYAAMALNHYFASNPMPAVEKRFCANLAYTVLDQLIRIDYVLARYLHEPEALQVTARLILRCGVCQFLFMDRVPEAAAVNECVKLARYFHLEEMTSLVNAVLRSAARELKSFPWPGEEDGVRRLSVMTSTPVWLVEKLIAEYGAERAEKICAFRGEHAMVIRPNLTRMNTEAFEKMLAGKVWQTEKAPYVNAWTVRGISNAAQDRDYLEGNFSIEGVSSMLCAEAMQPKPGMQLLDCCAAPGGKTAYLAEMMHGTGRILAWDIHEHRVTLIQAMMKRLHLDNIRPAVRDATVWREELRGSFDGVLIDAPCSGLGVIEHKPDIKLRMTQQQVDELTKVQQKLLEVCSGYVRPGGTLVYSTCSILPEENENRVRRFLSEHPEFTAEPIALPQSAQALAEGKCGLQILSHEWQGIDGFYIARMVRKKG